MSSLFPKTPDARFRKSGVPCDGRCALAVSRRAFTVSRRAFTMVELLVTITIMAILGAAISTASFSGGRCGPQVCNTCEGRCITRHGYGTLQQLHNAALRMTSELEQFVLNKYPNDPRRAAEDLAYSSF